MGRCHWLPSDGSAPVRDALTARVAKFSTADTPNLWTTNTSRGQEGGFFVDVPPFSKVWKDVDGLWTTAGNSALASRVDILLDPVHGLGPLGRSGAIPCPCCGLPVPARVTEPRISAGRGGVLPRR